MEVASLGSETWRLSLLVPASQRLFFPTSPWWGCGLCAGFCDVWNCLWVWPSVPNIFTQCSAKAEPFPTQGRSLDQWALCVLLVGINLLLGGNRSQAPSFMAYKLEGGWEIWHWCLAAPSLGTVSLFSRGMVGAGCLVSFGTPWKTVFTGYGNTLATCLFLWDSLPRAHWLLVHVSVWAV